MYFSILYVATIVLINWAFSVVPLFTLPTGDSWSPVALAVGFVFVVRDYAQRESGHKVFWAMGTGALLSFIMATPAVAFASLCAFTIGEVLDWAMFTFSGKPFSQRVLLSSCLSTPVDSAVFLLLIGHFSLVSLFIMTASKMLGAFLVFWLARHKERGRMLRPNQQDAFS